VPEPPQSGLNALRRAEQVIRDKDDAVLFELSAQLRSDAELWLRPEGSWYCTRRTQTWSPDALDILRQAVANDFNPIRPSRELEALGEETSWPGLERQIQSNVPPPPAELIEWPDAGAIQAIELYRVIAQAARRFVTVSLQRRAPHARRLLRRGHA
jgi:hypothetical protein